MRALMLAENLPFPTFKGGDLRNWQNVNALRDFAEVGVFGLCSNDRRTTQPLADLALWRCSSDPELALPPPASRVARSRRWLLDADGHPSDLYSEAAAAEVERVIADFQPEVVVVERLWLSGYIAHARRFACRVVLDDHNVEADLSWQLAGIERDDGRPGRKVRELLAQRTSAVERRATQAVDQIWVCSDGDRRLFERSYRPSVGVHVVPNGVDVEAYARDAATHRGNAARSGPTLVFPAIFTYAPNAAAARFLIDELLPCVHDARLVLVGGHPTAAMLDAARSDDRVVVTGTVPDVRPFLHEASAVVVPLFEGSGTRFKILEAFAARAPVITTHMGAAGLDVEDGTHVLFARTAIEFADAIERIRTDAVLKDRLVHHGYELVKRRYSWDAARRSIEAAVGSLVGQDVTQ